MKRTGITVAVVAFVIAGYFLMRNPAPPGKGKVVIGWIGPLTGPASFLGVDNLKAVEIAIEEYALERRGNEPKIELVVKDDQYKAELSLDAYRKLVSEENIDILILCTYTGMFLVADEALKDGVIVVDPIDNDANLARLNKNIFMIAKQTKALARVIANALVDGSKKVASIIYFDGDDFMPTLAHIVRDIFEKEGGRIAVFQKYPTGTTDFRSWLSEAKKKNIDASVFFGYVEIGFAMKQARELGIKAPFYTANATPKLQANSEGAAEGTMFAHFTHLDGNVALAKAFLDKYRARHKRPPAVSWTALQGYDAANLIINALRKAAVEDGDFVDTLRARIFQIHGSKGVSGDLSIKADGTSRGIEPSLYVLAGGKAVKRRKR